MLASLGDIGVKLFCSASSGWAGCPFDIYRLDRTGFLANAVQSRTLIALCLNGASDIEAVANGRGHRGMLTPGAMIVAGHGLRYTALRWSGSSDILLADIGGPDPAQPPIAGAAVDRFLFRDVRLSSLLFAMARETECGCASGRPYETALTAALDAYVAAHLRLPTDAQRGQAVLSTTQQIARVRAYVATHLGADLSLRTLAAVSRLSPSRVTALFRQEHDCSPHQFVIRERIAEARHLLRGSSLSIADIAARTGFADQSHLTKTFRRVALTTPKRYRLHA